MLAIRISSVLMTIHVDIVHVCITTHGQQTENLVRNQLTTALGITAETASKIEIEQAHRTHTSMSTPDGKGKTRTDVVRFAKYKDKECVLRQWRNRGESSSMKTTLAR